jgi:hypothetical protein
MSVESVVFDDCWFCRRNVDTRNLIAGYDTFDEQRLACDDCDRTLKAMARRGYYFQRPQPDPDPRAFAEPEPPPPSRPRGVVVIGLVLLALGIAVAVWGWHPWTA